MSLHSLLSQVLVEFPLIEVTTTAWSLLPLCFLFAVLHLSLVLRNFAF